MTASSSSATAVSVRACILDKVGKSCVEYAY